MSGVIEVYMVEDIRSFPISGGICRKTRASTGLRKLLHELSRALGSGLVRGYIHVSNHINTNHPVPASTVRTHQSADLAEIASSPWRYR